MKQTFEITITSRDHYTWQGILCTKQVCVPFHSELELLLEIARYVAPESMDQFQLGGRTE